MKHPFGVICFDGHGYAHPRRCGLASHLSIELDVPGVGMAKSRFIGEYDEPAAKAGSTSPLIDRGEQIGLVLRTRDNTRPIFISIGHIAWTSTLRRNSPSPAARTTASPSRRGRRTSKWRS